MQSGQRSQPRTRLQNEKASESAEQSRRPFVSQITLRGELDAAGAWSLLLLSERLFALSDAGALWSHFRIQLFERCPFFRQIVFVEDRRNRTFRDTCFAVDAFVWVNVEDLLSFVETFNRANDHAIGVFAVKARFGNDVCHVISLFDDAAMTSNGPADAIDPL